MGRMKRVTPCSLDVSVTQHAFPLILLDAAASFPTHRPGVLTTRKDKLSGSLAA